MAKYVNIKKQIERKTYLKGRFKGKFIGYLDPIKSDNEHENFYDLEVLSGEIFTSIDNLRTWKEGDEFEDFIEVEKFLTKLPNTLNCEITYNDDNKKYFTINLNEAKLIDYKLSKQVYEGKKVYGDIEGEISGYLIHYDFEEVEELIEEDLDNPIKPPLPLKTDRQSGKTEISGSYKRWEYYYSNNSTYWGDWILQGKKDSEFSFWNFIIGSIRFIFLILFIVPIIVLGWKVILFLLAIFSIIFFISVFQIVFSFLWKWFLRISSMIFFSFFIFGIISSFNHQIKITESKSKVDDSREVTKIKPEENNTGDSIISHYRIWQDYDNKIYSGNLEIRMSDFKSSTHFRNGLPNSIQSPDQYNDIVSRISEFDKNKLIRIYLMFDSLKSVNHLDQIQFAKLITSCIQDIPYTLILDKDCNPNLYNDNFIRSYLHSGRKCEGFIKYGLFSPCEFVGSLYGDCDTRTLLLFTILNHYYFDVAMLGSEFYKHSVLGINLPFNGVFKMINGKRYVIWETTQKAIEPGIFPSELSDMRLWQVNLITNN